MASGSRLFIGALSFDTDERSLKTAFEKFGTVLEGDTLWRISERGLRFLSCYTYSMPCHVRFSLPCSRCELRFRTS